MSDQAYLLEQADQFRKDKLKIIREYADVSLNQASARGTAVHAYIEDRLNGNIPNWELVMSAEAHTWIAAVEKFIADCSPEVVLAEVVCFDRDNEVAGTCDAVLQLNHPTLGGLWELDYKSRGGEHDRRTKEAAQLGAYHAMLTGKTPGCYYISKRGQRRTITDDLRMGIVTFCPDGTWAMHEVDVAEANTAYELSLAMRHQSKVSTLYAGKAIKSESPPEWQAKLNAELMDAILRIPADAPELGVLMREWKNRGLPKASEGAVTPERFGEAMALIQRHGSRWQPFPEAPEEEPTADLQAWGQLGDRWRRLPVDLREQVEAQGAHLPAITKTLVSKSEAEDWHRLVSLAETEHECRLVEAEALQKFIRDLPCATAAFNLIHGTFGLKEQWTKRDLELVAAIWDACTTQQIRQIDNTNDALVVNVEMAEEVAKDAGGKRPVIAVAKATAKQYGLTPSPSKWDDLIGSPVLYAAVIAA